MSSLKNNINLVDKVNLLYLSLPTFFFWLWLENFNSNKINSEKNLKEKKKWAEVIGSTDSRLNFFSGSKLLLVHKDIVLIQVETKEEQFFLSQTYDLDYQETCQKCWNEKKHLVVITAFQSKIFLFSSFSERENLTEEKALFLFKDEESLKRNLAKILTTKNVIKI